MLTKNELRKKANEIRKSLDMKRISEKIVENISNSEIYKKAQHVMIFYPIGHEVNLLALLKDNKTFYLPKVHGDQLLVCPYREGDKLIISEFKTQEPTTEPIDAEVLDIVFVPALMVDKNLHRLGYGGGFYDRFLSQNAENSTKIVAIPSALITDKLPSESFDAKIDVTICENLLQS
jgi:5-formyltetrahydrofolate cyclo-ligase